MDSVVQVFKEAGPFALLNLAAGGLGLVLALISVGLAVAKSKAAQWVAVCALLCAVASLALGELGHTVAMVGTNASLGNVPFEYQEPLLRKGTEEARANFLIALCAAALPLVAASLVCLLARFRPGQIASAVVALFFGGMLFQLTRPLPPLPPDPIVPPAGLELSRAATPRPPQTRGLVALTVEGVVVEGTPRAAVRDGKLDPAQRPALREALKAPKVAGHNARSMPVMADRRAPVSALLELVEAADEIELRRYELAVVDSHGAPGVFPFRARPEPDSPPPDKPLALTVTANASGFTISASGGALPVIGLREGDAACQQPAPPAGCFDFKALNDKLAEVKRAFPDNRKLQVNLLPGLSVEVLAGTLDAVHTHDGKLMHDELLVGAAR